MQHRFVENLGDFSFNWPPARAYGPKKTGTTNNLVFTARCYATAVLAMGLCPSVCVCTVAW